MLLLKYSLFLQETYFTIIVQRNTLYQTGADLQESLMCIYDLSDISVGNNVNVGYVFVSLKNGVYLTFKSIFHKVLTLF